MNKNITNKDVFGNASQAESFNHSMSHNVIEAMGGVNNVWNNLPKSIERISLSFKPHKAKKQHNLDNQETRCVSAIYHISYRCLLTIVALMLCCATTFSAQLFSYNNITDGTIIKIYAKGHYGEKNMALACSGNGEYLTSYEKAGSGDTWTLVDAGDNNFYLRNDLGCYWACQNHGCTESLKCALSQLGAVKIKLKYDSMFHGWGFWHNNDLFSSLNRALNNLEGSCYKYNWWSTKDDYDGDSNSTFDIELIQDGTGAIKKTAYRGFNFKLNLKSKTATLLKGDYTSIISQNNGKLTIPMYVPYGGKDYYIVTALDRNCFYHYDGLTEIIMSDYVTSIGESCFSQCVGLTHISLPRNLITLESYYPSSG